MFPKKKIDLRKGLTKHQREKISKEFNALAELAGGKNYLRSDFAKIVRTPAARQLQDALKFSKFSRGVLIKGAQKINGRVTVKSGALSFKLGENLRQLVFPLDASTEKTLEKTIRAHKRKINNENSVTYLGTHGGKIHYVGASGELEEENATDSVINQALEIFNKYLKMEQNLDENGNPEKRDNGRYAAHPDKWGMTLIIENADAYK